jgi:mRNA-degrading endonuclease RelE of RelBE toxin-antitoxin system
MPYELYIERHAEKDLKRLEASTFTEIAAKIKELADNPRPQGCRKITGSQMTGGCELAIIVSFMRLIIRQK